MKILCTRRFDICAGHRVMGHENKCGNLHGHNYAVWVAVTAGNDSPEVDALGRVIDFSELKKMFGEWLETRWDHGFVLHQDDDEAIMAVTSLRGQKFYLMSSNPTAENMARELVGVFSRMLKDRGDQYSTLVIHSINVQETVNCSATAVVENGGAYA